MNTDRQSGATTASAAQILRRTTAPALSRNLSTGSLVEIIELDAVSFVRCAYMLILQRPPDPDGERFYVRSLLRGVAKEDVLVSLRLSPEGRTVGADIPDFAKMRLRRNVRLILRATSLRLLSSNFYSRLFAAFTSATNIPRAEIVACFRVFFRRHPNEEEILECQLGFCSYDAMVKFLCSSEEFLTTNKDVLAAFYATNSHDT